MVGCGVSKQASLFAKNNINTKCKQYNGRLPEGNPSIELVAYSKYSVIILTVRRKKR